MIPVTKFPAKERKALESGCRPTPCSRRQIIRILCSEISAVCQKPGKKNLSVVAHKIVSAYPKFFEDVIEGTRVGYRKS